MKIRKIVHPYPQEIYQARYDESIVTGKPLIERPFWYENIETGQAYYDLYGCVGWPTEFDDKEGERPGYIAIVGIVKPKQQENPEDALFQLLAEAESRDVSTLLNKMLELRAEYGFGLHPNLLQIWFGDPERFITTLALKNERLTAAGGDEKAILIIPPDDFYDVKVFDNYVRSLRSCLMPDNLRLYLSKSKILRNRIRKFMRDDPAVMAVGGLVHSLLRRCEWLEQTRENVFVVEEGI